MAFKFGTGTPVETPQALQKPKGFIRGAAEFLAPTTTGLVTGEKKLNLRTGAGAALELASFLLPGGAIFKGAKAAAGAAKLARGARAVSKAKTPFTLESLRGGVKRFGSQLGKEAGRAAKIGATTGALAGGGRALGDEEKSLSQVAGEAAIGAATGGVGGAILAPAVSLAARGTRGIVGSISKGVRSVNSNLRPGDRTSAVRNLTDSYEASFTQDRTGILRKLDIESVKARRMGGPQDPRALIQELAQEGYMPKVEGALANMRPVLDDLADRRATLAQGIDRFLVPIKTKISTANFRKAVEQEVKSDFGLDIDKSLRQVGSIFSSIETKYGKSLTASNINEIRKQLNQITKSFTKEAFVLDTALAASRTANNMLDQLAPTQAVRTVNAEIARLFRLDRTARIFHNQKIDVGEMASALGRYSGVLAGGLVGAGAITGGLSGGSLVIAGIFATQGGKFAASLIRNTRFNPALIDIIRKGIGNNVALKKKLLNEATGADRKLLERVFQENVTKTAARATDDTSAIRKTISQSPALTRKLRSAQKEFGVKPGVDILGDLSQRQ